MASVVPFLELKTTASRVIYDPQPGLFGARLLSRRKASRYAPLPISITFLCAGRARKLTRQAPCFSGKLHPTANEFSMIACALLWHTSCFNSPEVFRCSDHVWKKNRKLQGRCSAILCVILKRQTLLKELRAGAFWRNSSIAACGRPIRQLNGS